MVGIQYNFIQWSSTLRGSAVHNNHNSIFTNYRVISPCYFSLSGAYLENYRLVFKTTSYNGQTQKGEVQRTRTITLSKVITELLPFVTFQLLSFVRTISWRLMVGIQYNFIEMVKHIERKCSAQEP
jgi:hypothetical protein